MTGRRGCCACQSVVRGVELSDREQASGHFAEPARFVCQRRVPGRTEVAAGECGEAQCKTPAALRGNAFRQVQQVFSGADDVVLTPMKPQGPAEGAGCGRNVATNITGQSEVAPGIGNVGGRATAQIEGELAELHCEVLVSCEQGIVRECDKIAGNAVGVRCRSIVHQSQPPRVLLVNAGATRIAQFAIDGGQVVVRDGAELVVVPFVGQAEQPFELAARFGEFSLPVEKAAEGSQRLPGRIVVGGAGEENAGFGEAMHGGEALRLKQIVRETSVRIVTDGAINRKVVHSVLTVRGNSHNTTRGEERACVKTRKP